jgi:hypothetical protein
MKLNYLLVGVVGLLIFLPIWYFAVVPEFEKMEEDYENVIHYNRLSNTNHKIGGEWAGERFVRGTTVEKRIKQEGNVILMEGHYIAQGLNNEKIWEVKKNYGIDAKTRKIINGYGQYADNSYYLFPTKLRSENYNIWFPQYLYPVQLNFIGIEKINELEVYHFEAKNFLFDDSEGFEYLDLVPEEYKVFADATVNVWVEPISGIMIDFEGGGVAYYADKNSNKKIQDMQTWSNKYTDGTITIQVLKAKNERFKLLLIKIVIPLLLAVAVVIITLFLSFKGEKKKGEAKK